MKVKKSISISCSLLSLILIFYTIAQIAEYTILNLSSPENFQINLWAFSDLLINYNSGFVRRGFLGSIFILLDSDGILYDTVTNFIFYNFLLFVFLIRLNFYLSKINSLQKFLFDISIFSYFNMAVFGAYYARKEIFIINLFLIQLIIFRKIKNKLIFFITSNIFFIISMLTHEGIAFFIYYPFTIYLFNKKGLDIKFININRIFSLLLLIFIFIFRGNSEISNNIIFSLSQKDLDILDPLIGFNAITFLSSGVLQAGKLTYILIFSGSLILWTVFLAFIPITISFITGESIRKTILRNSRIILSNKEFLLIPILFLAGWDWGRWILVVFYFLLFTTLLSPDLKFLQYKFSFLLTYLVSSLLTTIPDCCIEQTSTRVSSNYYRIYKAIEIIFLQLIN